MKWLLRLVMRSTETFFELALIYVGVVLSAGLLFMLVEHKSLGNSLWLSVVTAMTVGYGDVVPSTTVGRLIGATLMHIVPLFVIPLIIVRLLKTLVRDNIFTHVEQESIKADLADIKRALNITDSRHV